MKVIKLHKAISIRFHRWSRAKYAVFCSLGRAVSIGRLDVSVADKSLTKSIGTSIIKKESGAIDSESNGKLNRRADSELFIQQLLILVFPELSLDSSATKGSYKPISINKTVEMRRSHFNRL
jgi:hypothetical protein